MTEPTAANDVHRFEVKMCTNPTTWSVARWLAALSFAGIAACTGTIGGVGDNGGTGSGGPGATGTGSSTGGTQTGGTGTGSSSGTGSTGSTGTGSGGTGTGGAGFTCQANTIDPGPTSMTLLTRDQYLNTIHDLLNADLPQLPTVFAPAVTTSFGLVQGAVAQVDLENFAKGAELVGAAVAADATKLNALAPCAATTDKRTCARTFVQTFVARAYRTPMADTADVDRLLALYDVGATTSYAHGIELMVRATLQAPRFLYRVELGTSEQVAPNAVKLSGAELAARLSYAVWNTAPDAKLSQAAASGMLATKDGVAAQLTWMLADPKGATFVRRFLEGWVHLPDVDTVVKDTKLYPDWDGKTMRTAVRDQATSFFDYILGAQGGSFSGLLTSHTVFANLTTATYYGVTAAAATFQPFERPDGTVSGLLTLPAVLSTLAKPSESSPIYRGKFVRESLLCQELPAPPANVPNPPDTMPGLSTREKFRQHEVNPSCAGCHTLMDPIGLGFENFDSVGRYRTMDNGVAVDASGEVFETADIDGKFVGVTELGAKLAKSAEVESCLARQWFRFVMSRFEQDVDGCSMKSVADQFQAGGSTLNSLPQAIVQTDAFLYRRPIN